jgi:hypothetical protein
MATPPAPAWDLTLRQMPPHIRSLKNRPRMENEFTNERRPYSFIRGQNSWMATTHPRKRLDPSANAVSHPKSVTQSVGDIRPFQFVTPLQSPLTKPPTPAWDSTLRQMLPMFVYSWLKIREWQPPPAWDLTFGKCRLTSVLNPFIRFRVR